MENTQRVPGHYTFFVCFCFLLAPLIYLLYILVTPQCIILQLHGMNISALYKSAVRNRDNSIDLTINIPSLTNNILLDAARHTQELSEESSATLELRHSANRTVLERKTYYPLTMDSPYVINSPDLCSDLDPLHVLVIVHTATSNFQRRRLLREMWANKNLMTNRVLRIVFVLGLTQNKQTQMLIENEHVAFGDLIQGRFLDTYHNLTHKGVLAFRWIQSYCPHAQLILKVDDDMFVNPFTLYESYFPKYSRANRTIACHLRPKNTSPLFRAPKSKWKVDDYEFRGYKSYPVEYCNGYIVLLTPDLIRPLYKAAYVVPFFWVDDVYLFGLLPARVGNVTFVDIKAHVAFNPKLGMKCFREQKACKMLGTSFSDQDDMEELWGVALSNVSKSLRTQMNPAYLIK